MLLLRKVLTTITLAVALVAATTVAAAPPSVPDSAYGKGAVDGEDPRVESRLIVDSEQVAAGDTMRVGVLFSMDADWHIYWRNSGDAGMSTDISWSGQGVDYEPLTWPAPRAFEQKGEVYTFGYGSEVLLFSEANVADDASGEVTVEATVDYLACKIDCIPGSSTLTRTVSVGGESDPVAAATTNLFEKYADRVPKSPEEVGVATEVVYSQKPITPGDTFRAAVGLDFCREGLDGCRSLEVVGGVEPYRFIPDATNQVSWETTGVAPHPSAKSGQAIVLEGKASPNAPENSERFAGVVWLKPDDGEPFAVEIEAPLPRAESGTEVEQLEPTLLAMSDAAATEKGGSDDGAPAPAASSKARASADDGPKKRGGGMGVWEAILFAFLGGMILNLMPCVFPVLALKVTSFAELVHEDRAHKLFHGLAYTAGIVVSMLLLAGAVLGLRAAGTRVGWGFQFQNPAFPAVLAVVVVVFALNLFGVFEIQVESTELADATRKATGLRRSAAEGVLAVVLATPCSAPFLGTAVGFALTAHPATIVAVFAAIGFGLAAPFVVFVLVPGWSNVLPRPGDWMIYVKKVLGFTLVGAAIWLIWIVGRTTGVDGMLQLLILLGVAAFATWVYGTAQHADGAFPKLAIGLAALALLGTGWWALQFPERADAASSISAEASEDQSGIRWERWTEDRVDAELDKGRPVFVDFTADWCITCKANERTVLSSDTVVGAMADHNVATLKADWTDGDERITDKLREFGKGGVPMYLVYSPDAPDDPQVLPEVLTPSRVVDAIEGAAGEAEN